MKPLIPRIKEIVEKSQILREEKLRNINTSLDYVAVFSSSPTEYDEYNEQASNIGQVYSETNTGITYLLTDEIETVEGPVKLIKIRKPDKEKPYLGAPDYAVENYEDVKNFLIETEIAIAQKASDGFEILEIKGEEVLIYIPSTPLSSEVNVTVNEVSELELEKEKRIRLMADFENYKRRIEQEKATFGAIANLRIIQELLEINDDLGLALDDQELNLERSIESIKNAREKLKITAMNAGVETIQVSPGDDFNKETMEAIQAIPNPEMKNKVIAVISSAYKFRGKDGVLKSAKVIVGK